MLSRSSLHHPTLRAATTVLALALSLAGCSKKSGPSSGSASASPEEITLGFIVKQPDVPWFQLEWKFADQAAKEFGFNLRKIGAPDGARVIAAIDNLGASGAKGFIICTPEVKLGQVIAAKAREHNLKVIAVDDRFLKGDETPMEDVHYLGISARKIGEFVGESLHAEFKTRAWPLAGTAVCVVTFDQLPTARDRTEGAMAALLAAGFPKEHLFTTRQKTSDQSGAFDATNILLTQHGDVKRWMICGINDDAVLGAVRAMEGRGFTEENTLGIGINGTECIAEFEREKPTGFFASVLLSARQHGYETAKMLYEWVKTGKEPPLDTRTTGVLINRANFRQVLKEQGVRE